MEASEAETQNKPECRVKRNKDVPKGYHSKFHHVIVLCGVVGVGKTEISLQWSEAKSAFGCTKSTIGVDNQIIHVTCDGLPITIEIRDTGGQERFASMLPLYYRPAHAIAFVYDVSNSDSYFALNNLFETVCSHVSDKEAIKLLIANKIDLLEAGTDAVAKSSSESAASKNKDEQTLNDARKLIEMGEDFSRKRKILFAATSAKNSQNIQDALFTIISALQDKYKDSILAGSGSLLKEAPDRKNINLSNTILVSGGKVQNEKRGNGGSDDDDDDSSGDSYIIWKEKKGDCDDGSCASSCASSG